MYFINVLCVWTLHEQSERDKDEARMQGTAQRLQAMRQVRRDGQPVQCSAGRQTGRQTRRGEKTTAHSTGKQRAAPKESRQQTADRSKKEKEF